MKSNITFETKKSGFNNNERSTMYVLVYVCLLATLIVSNLTGISNASSETKDEWKTFQGGKMRRSGLLLKQINIDQDVDLRVKEIGVDYVRLKSSLFAIAFPWTNETERLRGATGNGEILIYRLVESKWRRVGVMDGCYVDVNQSNSVIRAYYSTWSGGGSRTTYRIDETNNLKKGEVTSYRNDDF